MMFRPSPVTARVKEDLEARDRLGFHKFKKPLEVDEFELRAWIEEAYEEALDLAVYLRGCLDRMELEDAEEDARGA